MKIPWECLGPMALLILVSGCSGYCVTCSSLDDISPGRNTEFASNSCALYVGTSNWSMY